MAILNYHYFSDADILVWANYYAENKATIRKTAEKFNVSKSTVHKAFSKRLYDLDRALYYRMNRVREKNKAERHLRGGLALAKKFKAKKN